MPVELHCTVGDLPVQSTDNDSVSVNKVIWSEDQAATFINQVMSDNFQTQLDHAIMLIDVNLEESVNVFAESLDKAADSLIKKIVIGGQRRQQARWFDNECSLKKRGVKRQLRKFRKAKANEDYTKYADMKKKIQGFA